jgi:hypothetical protein
LCFLALLVKLAELDLKLESKGKQVLVISSKLRDKFMPFEDHSGLEAQDNAEQPLSELLSFMLKISKILNVIRVFIRWALIFPEKCLLRFDFIFILNR